MGILQNKLEIDGARASWFSGNDEAGFSYAVFTDEKVQDLIKNGLERDEEDGGGRYTFLSAEQVCIFLTGWYGRWGGPGKPFSADPSVRKVGRAWIMACYSGLDI